MVHIFTGMHTDQTLFENELDFSGMKLRMIYYTVNMNYYMNIHVLVWYNNPRSSFAKKKFSDQKFQVHVHVLS